MQNDRRGTMIRIKKWLPVMVLVLALLGVLASWFRSHLYADQFGWTTDSFGLFIDIDSGGVMLTFSADRSAVGRMRFQAGTGVVHFRKSPSPSHHMFMTWRILGFAYEGDDGTGHHVAIPLYAITLFIGVLIGIVAGRQLRRTPSQMNTCLKCGYDLRATPARCPECGTEPMPTAE
jgi:hypothetical protein